MDSTPEYILARENAYAHSSTDITFALHEYNRAIDIFSKSGQPATCDFIPFVLAEIGVLFSKNGNNTDALEAFRRAISLMENIFISDTQRCHTRTGCLYIETKKHMACTYKSESMFEEAIDLFKNLMQYFDKCGCYADPILYSDCLYHIADSLSKLGRNSEAKPFIAKCVCVRRSIFGKSDSEDSQNTSSSLKNQETMNCTDKLKAECPKNLVSDSPSKMFKPDTNAGCPSVSEKTDVCTEKMCNSLENNMLVDSKREEGDRSRPSNEICLALCLQSSILTSLNETDTVKECMDEAKVLAQCLKDKDMIDHFNKSLRMCTELSNSCNELNHSIKQAQEIVDHDHEDMDDMDMECLEDCQCGCNPDSAENM